MEHFEEPVDDNPIYPCGICNKIITRNKKHIRCNICNFRIHIKCNQTDEATYQKMMQYEESMIKNIAPIFDTTLEGYTPYQTPTEGDKGGVSLYISKKHKCKRRNDLDSIIYKTKELESVFIELIMNNKKKISL